MNSKLITGLKTAINALQNDTVHYDWSKHHSCNCGIVAQSVLGLKRDELGCLTKDFVEKTIHTININTSETVQNATWKDSVKWLCPITGMSGIGIFDALFAAGMTKEDISHLEFMDNPAIIAEATAINKNLETKYYKEVTKKVQVSFFRTKEVKEKVCTGKHGFYSVKENLIEYLKAWVRILEKKDNIQDVKQDEKKSKVQLNKELLLAVQSEDYENAASIRNELALID